MHNEWPGAAGDPYKPAVVPPSATNSAPVQNDDLADARNSASSAISSGSPIRGMGFLAWRSESRDAMAVSMAPGWMELTRMLYCPNSSAATLVMPRTANLLET